MESRADGALCAFIAGAPVAAASAHPAPIALPHVAQLEASPPSTTVAAPPGARLASKDSTDGVFGWAVAMLTESTPPGGGRTFSIAGVIRPACAWLLVCHAPASLPRTTLAAPPGDGRAMSSAAARELPATCSKLTESAPPGAGREKKFGSCQQASIDAAEDHGVHTTRSLTLYITVRNGDKTMRVA